jgi:flagellar biosynthesis anti-sigma factor FlgM
MKIDTTQVNLSLIEQEQRASQVRTRQTDNQTQVEDSAEAQSSTAGTVAAGLQANPDIRSDKVAALQQAVASGQYQVDASAVAASMMHELM